MTRKFIITSAIIAAIGFASVPAMANDLFIEQFGFGNGAGGGQVGFGNLIGVHQNGVFNGANSQQFGNGNVAAVGQEGFNNAANTWQNGDWNQAGVGQFGANHTAVMAQDGNGNIAAGVQVGDGCNAAASQLPYRSRIGLSRPCSARSRSASAEVRLGSAAIIRSIGSPGIKPISP